MSDVDEMNAAECREALQEIEERQEELRQRREEIKPPPEAPAATEGPRYGRDYDPLDHAGPAYREAALGDDPSELKVIQEEYEEIRAELLQLGHRRDAIQRRLRTAEREERRAKAPEKARELMDRLPDALDRVDQLTEALASAIEERDALLRELDEWREENDGEPYYSPAIIRRVWAQKGDEGTAPLRPHHLRAHLSGRDEPLQIAVRDEIQGGTQVRGTYLADVSNRLAPPEEGVIEALKKRVKTTLAPGLDLGPRDEGRVRREADRVRARMIAGGEFDRLEDARDVAVEAIRERRSAPGRKPPPREEVAEQLS